MNHCDVFSLMGNGNDMKIKEVNGKEVELEICLLKITT